MFFNTIGSGSNNSTLRHNNSQVPRTEDENGRDTFLRGAAAEFELLEQQIVNEIDMGAGVNRYSKNHLNYSEAGNNE